MKVSMLNIYKIKKINKEIMRDVPFAEPPAAVGAAINAPSFARPARASGD